MDSLVKQQVDALLMQKDYDRVLDLCQADKHAWKALRTNLYATDALSFSTAQKKAGEFQVIRSRNLNIFFRPLHNINQNS